MTIKLSVDKFQILAILHDHLNWKFETIFDTKFKSNSFFLVKKVKIQKYCAQFWRYNKKSLLLHTHTHQYDIESFDIEN